MAQHIDGPLYYERMGRTGPVMAFAHPNPMDQSCWIFQLAHMSTWFRCIAIDVPGYGRSPKCRKGVTMNDVAQAFWEAIDEIAPGEKAILVGCSVGSAIITYMHNQRPDRTAALILAGTGYQPRQGIRAPAHRLVQAIRHRLSLALHIRGFQPSVPRHSAGNVLRRHVRRAATDMAISIRSSHQFEAHAQPNPEDHEAKVACPCDHPDRQRGRHAPECVPAAAAHQELRAQSAARRRTRLPDRAALAVQPAT